MPTSEDFTTETYSFKKAALRYIKEELAPVLFRHGYARLPKNNFVRERGYIIQKVEFELRKDILITHFCYEPVIQYLSCVRTNASYFDVYEGLLKYQIERTRAGRTERFLRPEDDREGALDNYIRFVLPQFHDLKRKTEEKIAEMDKTNSFEKLAAKLKSVPGESEDKDIAITMFECLEGDFETGRALFKELYSTYCEEGGYWFDRMKESEWTDHPAKLIAKNLQPLYAVIRDARGGRIAFVEAMDKIRESFKKDNGLS